MKATRSPARSLSTSGCAYKHGWAAATGRLLDQVASDIERFPDRPTLWPLLIGAWKQKSRE